MSAPQKITARQIAEHVPSRPVHSTDPDTHASCGLCRGALDTLDVNAERDCPHCGAALGEPVKQPTEIVTPITHGQALDLICEVGDGDVAAASRPMTMICVGTSSIIVRNPVDGWILSITRGSQDETDLPALLESRTALRTGGDS